MYLIVLILPLLGAISASFFGQHIGKNGARVITSFFMILTSLFSIYIFYKVGLLDNPTYIILGTWIKSELFVVNWGFLFDSLTCIMLLVVNLISTAVHIYSCEYMKTDPHLPRFMSYLSLFTFFMLILITADNFVQLFLGWEGVGLCSYLLINFWFTRVQANKAALKALLMNRIGDCGFLLGILGTFYTFRSVDFSVVFCLTPFITSKSLFFCNYSIEAITFICMFFFVGCVGKSAQIGLHTWLPDAMEGPTPVSALIHAATMVTAGVFLIIRCSPLFEFTDTVLAVITVIGALTAFFAATIGVFQYDLKKIIAYSTCSQLGYMMVACGLSNYNLGLFHLFNHAFFKALLFLSAGVVIHGLGGEQDIRRMGGLRQIFPFSYMTFLVGSLALAGFPFLTGFYSKDLILEMSMRNVYVNGFFLSSVLLTAAFLTAFYSFRLIYLVFLSKTNAFKYSIKSAHDAPLLMLLPLVFLTVGSIFFGYLFSDLIVGMGSDFLKNSILVLPKHLIVHESEFSPFYVKLFPTFLSFLGIVSSVILFNNYKVKIIDFSNSYYSFIAFFNRKWYFDYLYNIVAKNLVLKTSYNWLYKTTDKGIIETFGPKGLTNCIYSLVRFQYGYQSGLVYQYLCLIFLALIIIVFFFNVIYFK